MQFATLEDRRPITFRESVWTGFDRHSPGQQVDVLYDPANPQSATLTGCRPYWASIFLGVIGLTALATGILV